MHRLSFLRSAAFIATASFAAAVSILAAVAQEPSMQSVATISTSASPSAIARGHAGSLIIRVRIAPGFHIQAAKPTDPDLIATAFAPSPIPGVHFGTAKYPKPAMLKADGLAHAMPVYMGTVDIVVPFKVSSTARAGAVAVGGKLRYQGCNATSCYPPVDDAVSAKVTVK